MFRRFLILFIAVQVLALLYLGDRVRSGEPLPFPEQVQALRQWLSDQGIAPDALVPEQVREALLVPPANPNSERRHLTPAECADEGRAVRDKAPREVYRWRDERGNWVFADAAPAAGEAEAVTLAADGKEYFDLSVRYPAGSVPAAVRKDLLVDGEAVYRVYAERLGEEHLTMAELEFLVFGDRDAYSEFSAEVAPELAANTPGFYSAARNQAVVLHQGSRDVTRATALHEAVHVINARLFGVTPPWFNEGLAEYFEALRVRGQTVEIPRHPHWRRAGELAAGPLDLDTLVRAEPERWQGEEAARYYGSAWLFSYFLMEPGNRELMAALMAELAAERCRLPDSVALLERLHPEGMVGLERDWRAWLARDKTPTHRL